MPPSRVPSQHVPQQQDLPLYHIASGAVEALRNPYAQSPMNQFHNPYSVHYANAYMHIQQVAHTTPEGYTLSSTYDPRADVYRPPTYTNGHQSFSSTRGRGQGHRPHASNAPHQPSQNSSSWHQPGNSRCTYPSCSFSGSQKSVEIHMMDRHLIYPPNWAKQKKGPDWDADPSLKGKTIPIQGTSIILNNPEALDAWLAERKKRWPTAQRVEEKKAKMEEAIARGQLPLMNNSSRGTKRHRNEGKKTRGLHDDQPRISVQQKRQKTSQGILECQSNTSKTLSAALPETQSNSTASLDVQYSSSDEDRSDNDGAPEVVSSKQPTSHAGESRNGSKKLTKTQIPNLRSSTNTRFVRPNKKEPKLPPRNPFASRPTLLRNLLLPEIRMTVSNLSQAIRFIVDNDFLRDVELKPGQADHSLIEVLNSQPCEPAQVHQRSSTPTKHFEC
ncbi:hypothetical protein D9756_003840 [Leucocoprinus leucothites]|uniref:FMR1-interacting protein 1 conserved domain-containing protein n=1 Tax=Leucocoprinus leucothites TaxID=201217 RepID=A0A8H5D9H3_9AGAR|nr:hypothetical protein D9756_003840 [Leucoagaricus leucothites]